jgi:hypothetical protein
MKRSLIRNSFLTATLAGGIAASASGQVIFSDNFSYTNLADFQQVWTPTGTDAANGITFPTSNGTQYTAIQRSATNNFTAWVGNTANGGWSVTPTDANPFRVTATLYDPGTGAIANNSVGLRQLGGISPLFEMGLYQPGNTGQYAIRVLNMGVSPDPGWVFFVPTPVGGTSIRTEGWHTFEATFTGSSIEVTLDLHSDGIVNHTLSYVSTGMGAFSDLRIGGPGGAAATGAPIGYGYVHMEVIPEPSTYAAIFGGLALLGAFVYRRRLSAKK